MAIHDEFAPTSLTELIGHIYEAVANPAHWAEFLAALETHYPGSRITLFGHEKGGTSPGMTFHRNFAHEDLQAYLDYYVSRSPYIGREYRLETGRPSFYEVMVDDAEMRGTEIFNDYIKPRRLGHYGTGVVVDRGPGRITALSFAEHRDDERRRRQLRLLELLTPHLLRALRLRRLNAPAEAIGGTAGGAFDRWDRPAFVLDASGRVVIMNRLAVELTQGPHGVSVGADALLTSFDAASTIALHAAIRRCAAVAGAAGTPPSALDGLIVPRTSGKPPFQVMLSPLPFLGRAGATDSGSGTVLLVLLDPDRVRRAPIEHIARQFRLTPAEQRLAEHIINGVKLADAAELLGIQVSTARSRLKVIQTKTHCRRQVDLVRLAYELPARPERG